MPLHQYSKSHTPATDRGNWSTTVNERLMDARTTPRVFSLWRIRVLEAYAPSRKIPAIEPNCDSLRLDLAGARVVHSRGPPRRLYDLFAQALEK